MTHDDLHDDGLCDNYEMTLLLSPIVNVLSPINQCDNTIALYHKGVTHYVSADFSETIRLVNRVLELDPKHRWAYVIKGNAFNERGEYRKAMETFQECVKITHDNFDVVYNAMGNCYFLQEDFQGCLATYNKSISLALNTFTLANIHPSDAIFRVLENDRHLFQICQNVLAQTAQDGIIPYIAPDFSKLQLSPVEERYKTRMYERVYLMKYTTACLTILNKGLTLVCMNRFMEALDCFLLIIQVSHALMGKSIFKVGKRQDPTCMTELIELLNNEEYMHAKNNGSLAYDSRTSHCIAYCGIGIVCEALTSNLYSNECGMGCPCSSSSSSSLCKESQSTLTTSTSSSDIAADPKQQQHRSMVSSHSGFCRGTFKDMLSFNKKNALCSMADLFFERADRLIEDTRMRREVLYFKGEGLRNIRDYKKSIEYYQKGLEMNPFEIRSMIGLGRVSINLQDLKTARLTFKKILDITDYDHPIAMKYLQVVKMTPYARNDKANIYCDLILQCQH